MVDAIDGYDEEKSNDSGANSRKFGIVVRIDNSVGFRVEAVDCKQRGPNFVF